MNKNLERIKKYRDKAAKHVITGVVLDCLNVIEAAAERMAAEIERQHQNDLINAGLIRKHMSKINSLESEIACLRAELEKRPEIINCNICSYKGQKVFPQCEFLEKENGFCSWGIAGVPSRESEEGK